MRMRLVKKTFKMTYIALLIAIGLVIHMIEAYIPIPVSLPGAKLGLANIASLLTVVLYGPVTALGVSTIRSVVGALLLGGVAAIPYSLSGAIFSTIIMWMAVKFLMPATSLIGVSVLGAAAHNVAQLAMAALILSTPGIFVYLPVLLIIGTITGYFIGLAGNQTIRILEMHLGMQRKNGGDLR